MPAAGATASPANDLRVLLVGNSYTRFNVMPTLLRRLAASVNAGPPLRVEAVAKGGYSLSMHWRRSDALRRIRGGRYTHVVLQEHSLRPVDRAQDMGEYVDRFVRAIQAQGADPVLYETWPRQPETRFYRERNDLADSSEMYARIAGVYRSLASRHGARLAPVGTAFVEAFDTAPDISLYRKDGAHPTVSGSYLAACVIYGAISGRDPRDATYVPWSMPPERAVALRGLAHAVLTRRALGRDAAEPLPLEPALPTTQASPPAVNPTAL